ncbi:MAG: prephenate dehydrogenase [Candidatus Eisenbacteria bacterium]|uniref:Prephenate dehydrogenase n=1 Tax=Eiseniibacteriota bacterium TaxID=2212470 RepID=A0A956N9W6_UNCEI|nr:prephenate dehydrogenase [Candidatus Eisenbacteria bacterium]
MKADRPRYGIIGYGRFGELVVRYLEAYGRLVVCDPGRQVPFPLQNGSLEAAASARAVILAVPIRMLEDTLQSLRPHLTPGTVVVDVASVKSLPMQWMETHLPPDVDYVGTHPLFGPDSSRTGIRGHRIVVVPGRIARSRLERMYRLLDRLGLRIISTTAEEHDRAMARTQALTHWLGRSLTAFGVGPESIDTHGYRLLAQVAEWASRDSRELFQDMHQFNPFTQDVRARFRDALTGLDAELSSLTANPAPEDET